MKNEEILKKAIEKAIKNGYKPMRFQLNVTCQNYFMIIFSHNFAKAFWGEESIYNEEGIPKSGYWDDCVTNNDLVWQFHLQQMVLEEDPIKYLEQFLD